jgi:hypothetical protein
MIYTLVVICCVILLLGCGQYNSENLALGINKKLNERAQKKLLPIGATRFFEVIATVESDRGVETKSEIVEGRVIGHVWGGTKESYSLKYGNKGEFVFYNNNKDRLFISNKRSGGLFDSTTIFEGEAQIDYSNGTFLKLESPYKLTLHKKHGLNVENCISRYQLWKKGSIEKYGFRWLKYEVKRTNPPENE